MAENKVFFIGDKESFIVRVLTQKVKSAGINCVYIPCTVDAINAEWTQDSLLVLYVDDGARPKEDVLHYLADNMEDKGSQLILIGEQVDLKYFCDNIHGEYIYKTFSRPVDNNEFTATISDFFKKVNLGEFKKSILIIDDDTQYLSLIREWLRGTYKVYMANSGLQGIKLLGKNKVDLILLDHEMPVTSGPQVLEMLRSDTETSSIPVMFLTGKSDKESVMAVVALRPEGYFLKTIQRDELLKNLKEYFALHR